MNPLTPATADRPLDAPAGSRAGGPDDSADAPAVRVLVADAQAIDRSALAMLLRAQPGLRVIAEAATGDEALALARAHAPDVVVMSTALPVATEDSALLWLLASEPSLRVVALSERGWERCVVLNPPTPASLAPVRCEPCAMGADCLQLAIAHGALGTVRRSADPERLFAAVRAVAAGNASHDPAALEAIGRSAAPGSAPHVPLSAREREVVALIGRGLSNKEISAALAISEPTVKKHVGRVLDKLGVEDRLQAGLFVTRHPHLFAAGGDRRAAVPARTR